MFKMQLVVYLIVLSVICAVYAWYDAPFLFRWYQRFPLALFAFVFGGGYVFVIAFRAALESRKKYIERLELEARTVEIEQKYNLK